jgi:hypothetical protein
MIPLKLNNLVHNYGCPQSSCAQVFFDIGQDFFDIDPDNQFIDLDVFYFNISLYGSVRLPAVGDLRTCCQNAAGETP